MQDFKILINTESAFKDNVPHLLVTGIKIDYKRKKNKVEFDCQDIYDREDKYGDVVGFYSFGNNILSQTDIDSMTQWVENLGKSLILIIESEGGFSGWLFVRQEGGKVFHRVVYIASENDVNYDVWLKREGTFWNPADFLLEDSFLGPTDNLILDLHTRLDLMSEDIRIISQSINKDSPNDTQ